MNKTRGQLSGCLSQSYNPWIWSVFRHYKVILALLCERDDRFPSYSSKHLSTTTLLNLNLTPFTQLFSQSIFAALWLWWPWKWLFTEHQRSRRLCLLVSRWIIIEQMSKMQNVAESQINTTLPLRQMFLTHCCLHWTTTTLSTEYKWFVNYNSIIFHAVKLSTDHIRQKQIYPEKS